MLAEMAQRHGLTSVVDGAHVPGMLALRFRELGVDFLASSGAKWQCGPARTGVLYLRNKVLPQFNPNPLPEFWPTVTSSMTYPAQGGLPPRTTTSVASYDVGALLQDEGNPSIAQITALAQVCQMWDTIGRQRIQDYVLGLARQLKQRIAERWGAAALYSPMDDPRLDSALTTFNPFANPADVLDLNKANTFVSRLHDEEHITIRNVMVPVIGSAGLHFPIRVSTHLFHDLHDVERFVASAWKLSREMA
jgi:selenocysteine lyase/cysteine desulfurase